MTVRTLSGATVTLIGRGANYFDGDKIIPSFVDAGGAQYFIVNDPDDLTAIPAIVNGLLTVNAAAVPPIQIAAANAILVNDPTTTENSTSALVFAKRCGIEVSASGIRLYKASESLELDTLVSHCLGGVFCLYVGGEQNAAAYVDNGWHGDFNGYIGCEFEVVDSAGDADQIIEAMELNSQWNDTLVDRRLAHNAWIFVLAGVPESVFAYC